MVIKDKVVISMTSQIKFIGLPHYLYIFVSYFFPFSILEFCLYVFPIVSLAPQLATIISNNLCGLEFSQLCVCVLCFFPQYAFVLLSTSWHFLRFVDNLIPSKYYLGLFKDQDHVLAQAVLPVSQENNYLIIICFSLLNEDKFFQQFSKKL